MINLLKKKERIRLRRIQIKNSDLDHKTVASPSLDLSRDPLSKKHWVQMRVTERIIEESLKKTENVKRLFFLKKS